MSNSYDAIVVGTGISGGWAAKELTEQGLKTLVLDRGRMVRHGEYPTAHGLQLYQVCAIPLGFSLMFGAGALSGLLGIGSGAAKVLAMDQAMRLPFKVSTTTSNFMIGVTAAASAGVYLNRGYIDPGLAMPVMLGVLMGSMLGAQILVGAKRRGLRVLFR